MIKSPTSEPAAPSLNLENPAPPENRATPSLEAHLGETAPALSGNPARFVKVHSVTVRITHWLNALAFLVMLLSGWRIYNASPIFAFRFPNELTLGGWLGGALLWHFAAMWLLVINGLVYLGNGFLSGHFQRKFWPISPAAVWNELCAALRGRLKHEDLSVYNAVQRLAYVTLLLGVVLLVASGLAIWKPTQLAMLTNLFGGFDNARVVHFVAMALTLFVVAIHIAMALLVPATLRGMITGRLKEGSPR